MKKPVLIVLIGPTGVGKTELSLSIAEKYHTSIISSDSRQLYKDLKIGTAAPTPDQLKRVPHYFVGTLELTDYYSAAQFEAEVLKKRGGSTKEAGRVIQDSSGSSNDRRFHDVR